MMMGTGCVGCIYIGMHIRARLCNTIEALFLLLLIWDYVILWWMKRGVFLRRWIGLGAFFAGIGKSWWL